MFLVQSSVLAEDCFLLVKGRTLQEGDAAAIEYANIYIEEIRQGVVSDSNGFFSIKDLCPGEYHLVISHIGCEAIQLHIDVQKDTTIQIFLNHNAHFLDEVSIEGHGKKSLQDIHVVENEKIIDNANQSLSELLKNITGVSSIKTGSNISIPMVHGLSGKRLTILNNGVTQNGQQWGIDHSPEIDPLSASKLSVVKGVSAIEYQGNSLGGVVLIEPKGIIKEPHIHGTAMYFFETNGLGNGGHLELQNWNRILAWKINGTLKKAGDKRSPNYYLTNTGYEEQDVAIQLEKKIQANWNIKTHISSYNTKIGVLRGSHIGNLTDLQTALQQDTPFFTQPSFSYDINAPRQQVNHHMIKLNSTYFLNQEDWIELTYAGQLDYRKEYDVRRGGRTTKPALSLDQNSQFIEAKYEKSFKNQLKFKTGFQWNRIDNKNLSETGILPLIPDYIEHKTGVFLFFQQQLERLSWELGTRYDYTNQQVAAISIQIPREIIRYQNNFSNPSIAGGVRYALIRNLQLVYNIGYASRNPNVNELYSNGLHQGVSGIEEGNINLQPEQSIKTTFSLEGKMKEKVFWEVLTYYQHISNYIFLNPQNQYRLTIRGAFPLFRYEQSDATLLGLDVLSSLQVKKRLKFIVKYSFLKGTNTSDNIPLVNMPSNRVSVSMHYPFGRYKKIENIHLSVTDQYVFKQGNLLASQDFVIPPAGYNWLQLKLSAEKQLGKLRMNFYVKIENALNTVYRDYLNRQRYFADEVGRNFVMGVKVDF